MAVTMKGSGLKPNLDWIRSTYGDSVWAAVVDRLDAEERQQIEMLNAAVSYPVSLLDHVVRAFAEVRFPGDSRGAGEACIAMGKAAAEAGLSGIFSVFLKVSSPEATFKRAVNLLSTLYSGVTAEADVTTQGDGSKLGVLTVNGLGEIAYAGPRLIGFAEATFARLRVRDVSVRERGWEQGRITADPLVFEVRWRE